MISSYSPSLEYSQNFCENSAVRVSTISTISAVVISSYFLVLHNYSFSYSTSEYSEYMYSLIEVSNHHTYGNTTPVLNHYYVNYRKDWDFYYSLLINNTE